MELNRSLFTRDCMELGLIRAEEYIERYNRLISILIDIYDYKNLKKAVMDDEYREKMFDYYRL